MFIIICKHYNRTYVELKFSQAEAQATPTNNYNRTYVELKFFRSLKL